MKAHSTSRGPRGFTLIELLVVIAIVAVLAGLSFAGINVALKKTRTTEGQVTANTLAQGIERFYNEYSRLPEVSADEITTDQQTGVELLKVLMAQEEREDLDNNRSIVFFEPKEGRGRKGGVIYNQNNQIEGLYDPFGNPFTIILNTDYEDQLEFNYGGQQYRLRNKQVVVYSAGADREEGTIDDIMTFERRTR